jgi:hypothetical protein
VLVREAFVREFANGKTLGSYAGLTPTPFSSGATQREQGIGKAGNRRFRTVMIELAWLWQRYQPRSAQVSWFRERAAGTGRRMRKVMVVAMAAAPDRLVAVRDPGRGARGRGHKPRVLIRLTACARTQSGTPSGAGIRIQGGVAVVRQESAVSQSGAALLELSRPERGTVVGTSSPPDVRFAGKCPAVTRTPPWMMTEACHGAHS